MTWLEITFWALQGLFDLFALFVLSLLVLAHGTLDKRTKAQASGMFAVAKNVDDRFHSTNTNVRDITNLLVQVFGLDKSVIKEEPPPVAPPSGDLKN